VERFRTEGGELTITARPAKALAVFAGVSGLAASPADLPYAPRWSWTGGATWRLGRGFTLGVDGSYVARQYAASQARAAGAANVERIGAFALLNVRLAYAMAVPSLRHPLELFVAGENVLDRDYRYRPGYPMPGAGVTLGANARF
jgi:iron complex outermembrane receptor protein